MRFTRLSACLIPCLALTSTLGCGDDDDGGGNGGGAGKTSSVDTGVDDSKPLSMLTEAEIQQLSQGFAGAAQGGELVDAICKFSAVISSAVLAGLDPNASDDPVQACTELYNECKTDALQDPDLSGGGFLAPPPETTSELANCNVTVGELEACWNEVLTMIIDVFGAASCENPDVQSLQTSSATLAPPASCNALTTQCSAFAF